MDFAELRPDVNRELLIFTRVARLVCARESSARDSRGGYNLPGERRERERGGGEAPASLAPSAMYYLVLGTMGFVCKSFETRNQVERPPTSRAGCSGSSKGAGETEGEEEGTKFARRCILGCGDTSLKSERAKGNVRKRAGREKDGERRALLHNAACFTRVTRRRGK